MIGSLLCAQLRRLLLLCLIFVVQLARADLAVEITEPRQFGYVLGDKIERVFLVESANNVQLNKEKLRLGRIDTWFSVVDIRDLGVSANKPKSSLTYQVINVPEAPSMVEIASRKVDVIADGKPAFVEVPKLLVTIAPLTPRLVSNMGGLENIQPDEDVGMISSVNAENRLQVYSLILILPFSLLLFCWMPWDKFFRTKNLPFNKGRREVLTLLKLKQNNFEEKSLRIFHNALNTTFKKTIFVEEVREACEKIPSYIPLIEDLEYFLRCSQKYFYSDESFKFTSEQKERFCRLMNKLALIEKGLV